MPSLKSCIIKFMIIIGGILDTVKQNLGRQLIFDQDLLATAAHRHGRYTGHVYDASGGQVPTQHDAVMAVPYTGSTDGSNIQDVDVQMTSNTTRNEANKDGDHDMSPLINS